LTLAFRKGPQGSSAATILFVAYLSGIFDKVEAIVPGVRALSFVNDISRYAEGTDNSEVPANLMKAVAAAIKCTSSNGVSFDHGKTEAALFQRRKKKVTATATVLVGTSIVLFNKVAISWLRVSLN